MCKAVEDYAKEREKIAIEEANAKANAEKVIIVDNLINEGFTLEKALRIVGIDEDTYNKYKVA